MKVIKRGFMIYLSIPIGKARKEGEKVGMMVTRWWMKSNDGASGAAGWLQNR